MDTKELDSFTYHSTRDPDFKSFKRSTSFYEDATGIYSFRKKLGSGIYGKVRLFRHEKTRSLYVIKEVEEKNFSAREQKFTALVHSRCRSALSPKGAHRRIEMLYLGMPLGDIIKTLMPKEGLNFYLNILKEVARLHESGIVHLDLHRYNILVTKEDLIKLCDFGISRNIGNVTASFVSFSGASHMAPELRVPRRAHPRQDVYSLGMLIQPGAPLRGIIEHLSHFYVNNLDYFRAQMVKRVPEARAELNSIIPQIEMLIMFESILAAASREDVVLLKQLLEETPLSAEDLHAITIYAIRGNCRPDIIPIFLSFQPDLLGAIYGQHALLAAIERGNMAIIRAILEKLQDNPGVDLVLRDILHKQIKNDNAPGLIQALKIWAEFPLLEHFFQKKMNQSISIYIEDYVTGIFSNNLDDSALAKLQGIGLLLDGAFIAKIANKKLAQDDTLTVLTGAAKNGAFKVVNYLVNEKHCKQPGNFATYLSHGLIRFLNKSTLDFDQLKYFFSKKFPYDLTTVDPVMQITLNQFLVEWLYDSIHTSGSTLFCQLQSIFPDALFRQLLNARVSSESSTLLTCAVLKNPYIIEHILQYFDKGVNINQRLSFAFCHLIHLKRFEEAYLLKAKYLKIDMTVRHISLGLTAEQLLFRDICHAARCNQIELLINLKQLFSKEFLKLIKKEDPVGNTPLMIAIINSKDEATTYLLQKEHQPQLEFMQKFIAKGLYGEVHKVLREYPSIMLHSLWDDKQTIEYCLFEKFLHALQKGNLEDLSNMQKNLPLIVDKFLAIKNSDHHTIWDILHKIKQENPELRYSQVCAGKPLFGSRPNDTLIKWLLDQINKFTGVGPLKATPDSKTISLPYGQIYNWVNGLHGFVKPEEGKAPK